MKFLLLTLATYAVVAYADVKHLSHEYLPPNKVTKDDAKHLTREYLPPNKVIIELDEQAAAPQQITKQQVTQKTAQTAQQPQAIQQYKFILSELPQEQFGLSALPSHQNHYKIVNQNNYVEPETETSQQQYYETIPESSAAIDSTTAQAISTDAGAVPEITSESEMPQDPFFPGSYGGYPGFPGASNFIPGFSSQYPQPFPNNFGPQQFPGPTGPNFGGPNFGGPSFGGSGFPTSGFPSIGGAFPQVPSYPSYPGGIQPGFGQSGFGPGFGQPGYGPGFGQPGFGQGFGQPGFGPGFGQPGINFDPKANTKAKSSTVYGSNGGYVYDNPQIDIRSD